MKKVFKNFLLFIVLLTINIFALNAQIDDNRYKVSLSPEDLATCGGVNNSFERVYIQGKNASCNNFSITFNLPDGVMYEAGTAVITSQLDTNGLPITINPYVIDVAGTPNNPIFTLYRNGDPNINWNVGDEVFFEFKRSADCDAVALLNSGGLFKDAHTINFNDNGGPNSATDNDNNISSYALLAASLNISSINTVNANVGETYTRNITIAQGGLGCTETFTYYVDLGEDVDDIYSLSYQGTPLTPTSTVGQVLTYEIDLNSSPFFQNVGNNDNASFYRHRIQRLHGWLG